MGGWGMPTSPLPIRRHCPARRTPAGLLSLIVPVGVNVKDLVAFSPIKGELQPLGAPEIALFQTLARFPDVKALHVLAPRFFSAAEVLDMLAPLKLAELQEVLLGLHLRADRGFVFRY